MAATHLAVALGLALGQLPSLDNLAFRKKTLDGWEGKGFVLTKDAAVSSADDLNPVRTGMIRHVIVVPANARAIRFQAYLLHPPEHEPDGRLDVMLAGEKNAIVPKLLKTPAGWSPTSQLLSRWQNKPRDYQWDVSGRAGKLMQIVVVDQDERPGCFVWCSGFELVLDAVANNRPDPVANPAHGKLPSAAQDQEFAAYMLRLEKEHKLAPMARFDSKRFTAMGNADDSFMRDRVRACETFYDLFFDHFGRKGFAVYRPNERLMMAIFDGPAGYDAYLGRKMPAGVTGIYHPASNRLVTYDLSEHQGIAQQKKKALKEAGRIKSALDRARFVDKIESELNDWSKDLNLTTLIHECAHQLSFNCGLLNRQGDVPIWLAEGLACYCEATERGERQAIGALNAGRVAELAKAKGKFLSLDKILKDEWRDSPRVLLGYAQSWALYRMLMQEPKSLSNYLAAIYERRTPEYRLDDFREAFGQDLKGFEMRYHAYMQEMTR